MKKTREYYLLLQKLADRAADQNLLMYDKTSLEMDLDLAFDKFNLKLEGLLKADDFNFAHDICGIQNHINREKERFEGFFIPRYANLK